MRWYQNPITVSALLLLGVLSLSASHSKSMAKKVEKSIPLIGDLNAQQVILDNGLTVFLIKNKKAPVTSIYHWVKAGSLNESQGITGIAHLFEHMMFRPLDKKSKGFFENLKELGGTANANTRFSSTVYTTTTPHENLDKVLKLESDRFKSLKVTDELLNVERKAVWSEYSTKFDANPMIDLWYTIYHFGFPGHPYGWTVIGEREDLEKIKATDCNSFFSKYYRPNNVGLFISGDFDTQKILESIKKHYGSWKKGPQIPAVEAYTQKPQAVFATGKLPSQSKSVLAGFRIPEYSEKNAELINLALYFAIGSDLSLAKKRLQYKEKLASMVTDFNNDYDSGMVKFLVFLLPSFKYEVVTEQLLKITDDFSNLSNEEFSAYLNEYQIKLRESSLRNESLNGLLALSWGKWGSAQVLSDSINKPIHVTKEELLNFYKKYFTKDNIVIAVNKAGQP